MSLVRHEAEHTGVDRDNLAAQISWALVLQPLPV